ncbi:hypothetical protein V3481_002984 [Fusarium oxysporum f. sp. vasinfectum]
MTNSHAPSSSPGAALHPLSHLFLSSPVPICIVTPRQPQLKRALVSFLDLAPKEASPPITQLLPRIPMAIPSRGPSFFINEPHLLSLACSGTRQWHSLIRPHKM